MKQIISILFVLMLLTSCGKVKGKNGTPKEQITINSKEAQHIFNAEIPLQANTYTTAGKDIVNSNDGSIREWTDSSTVLSTFFRVSNSGNLSLGLNYTASNYSKIKVSYGTQSFNVNLIPETNTVFVGNIDIMQAGYIRIDFQGLERNGNSYATINAIKLGGEQTTQNLVFVNNSEYYYWGRRGPAVHLRYTLPSDDIEWFYNEATVPAGFDPIGSYYVANGFSEGYFGFQVNGTTERRILFSIWSPHKTDNPAEISESDLVLLNRKSNNVTSQAFGGEGSGRQNFMRFQWKTGLIYGFLTRVRPDPIRSGYTEYTSYFYDPETKKWMLVASNSRPKTTTFYKSAYSFSEGFDPVYGYLPRKVYFGNMWVRSKNGVWKGLTTAMFSFDSTAEAKQRMDHKGGVENNQFYLQNCGFQNDYTNKYTYLTRIVSGNAPVIDLDNLP